MYVTVNMSRYYRECMFVCVYACSEYRYVGLGGGGGGGEEEGSNQLCSSINSVYKAPSSLILVSYTRCFVIIVSCS